MIYLPSSSSTTNGQVPLSAFVHVEQHTGPLLITHFGQLPADHDFVQYRAGRVAWRRGRRH